MKLAWNAIVKNEAAIIERCVNSLLPHVDGAVIVDTGSTDGTPERIVELFDAANKPVEIHHDKFVNFEQARNVALQCARNSKLDWDYLLLADADMEFKVKQQPWLNGEKGLSYDLRQTSGSVGYYNRRLVSRLAQGWYVGVTHEYLDVPTAGTIDAAEFLDHGDGANRPEKFSRDIALLEMALRNETNIGLIQRYHFYLAGTYFDSGQFEKAMDHYRVRVALGGFQEEVWYAQMRLALCFERLGNKSGMLQEMLKAYQMRSHRVEPLYELAKFYRERGDNETSLLFSSTGLQLPHARNDLLFVNDWAYKFGIKEEFAICAYYDARRRKQGAMVCDELVLMGSGQARGNQYWYLEPLVNYVSSFQPKRIPFDHPSFSEGWVAMNPSVINRNVNGKDTAIVLVRTVNYWITPEGQYAIRGTDGSYSQVNPITTRNYLCALDDEFRLKASGELLLPTEWPEPKFDLVRGFEDSRLFEHDGKLWTVSTVRELSAEGLCEQVVTPLDDRGYSNDWTVFESHQHTHEKNWMPWVLNGEIQFVHRLGSMLKMAGGHGFYRDPKIDVSRISGGSQVINADGTYLALVHEAGTIPGRVNRYYQHRFVVFDSDGGLVKISPPFYFHDRQIEFAAGLAYFPKKQQLVASYGIRDCEAWLATMDIVEVLAFIDRGHAS